MRVNICRIQDKEAKYICAVNRSAGYTVFPDLENGYYFIIVYQ